MVSPPPHRAAPSLDAHDLLLALFAATTALVVFTLAFQTRLYGDASFLHFSYLRGEANYHPAHWLITRAFTALGADLMTGLRMATLLPAALAPAALFLALRRTGASRTSSLWCAALAAASSSSFFFSTTIEVHAIQMAGAHLGFLALSFLPGRTPLRSLALGALGAGLLAGSHTTSILVLPAVLVLFAFRQREVGTSRAELARWFAVLGLVATVVVVLVVRRYQEVQKVTFAELVDWALWDLTPVSEESWVPAPLLYLETQMVRPLFLLFPLAALGVLVDLFRDRVRASVTLLWIAIPAFALAGMPFNERGAYFLTLVPVLAWTIAHAGDLVLRIRLLAWPLFVAALVMQGIVAEHKQSLWDKPLAPEGRAWVTGLLDATGGRGVFLTVDPAHFEWADSYTTIVAEDARKVLGLPPDEVEAFSATYAAWARRAADTGDPLYVDAAIAEYAKLDPLAGRSMAVLEDAFDLEPVESGPFHALRGR